MSKGQDGDGDCLTEKVVHSEAPIEDWSIGLVETDDVEPRSRGGSRFREQVTSGRFEHEKIVAPGAARRLLVEAIFY